MIIVTVRCFITPAKRPDGIELGKPFECQVPIDSTLGDLVKKVLAENAQPIVVMVVNGEVALEKRRLSSGDTIDFYPLVDGG